MNKLCEVTLQRLKYPVLLVHGIGYRDDIKIKTYWSDIPKFLSNAGANVFFANQDAFGTHQSNAIQIKKRIEEIFCETGAEKINIIAHSKGGLEVRYMISKLGMGAKVASLTTLATPHRGSFLAELTLEKIDKISGKKFVNITSKIIAKLLGDKNPNFYESCFQLTETYMSVFNENILDDPRVFYQSYGGIISENYPVLNTRSKCIFLKSKYGDNDGVVPVSSYKWGQFKGIVGEDTNLGISHFEIIGLNNISKFNLAKFYKDLVYDLAEKGF